MEKQVIWSGAVLDPSGYGEASRNYVLGLARHGELKLHVRPRYFWSGDSPDLGDSLDELLRLGQVTVNMAEPYVFIQHTTPDQWKLGPVNCIRHIGMTTFETDRLPSHWHMQMRAMDELWTFSHWAADVFRSCGIQREIHVFPHGVDSVRFCPEGEKLFEGLGEGVYVFGSNFDWTERKNPGALLKAYFTEFKADDPVALALKVYYQYPVERSQTMVRGYIENVKSQMGLTSIPPVILLNDILPEDLVPSFYRSLDCYVLPSRGEGWSLTHSEAMATGLPAIGVNWSGNTEFMKDNNSLLLKDYKLVEITAAAAGAQQQYTGHRWADCSVEELAAKMRWAFDNREQAKAIGREARIDMTLNCDWADSASAMMTRLREIFT
jgi:glycosyltransferase involved in cell wall biosynthesis